MPVPPVARPAVDLSEPAQPFGIDQVGGPLELGEVLLESRVRQVGEDVGPQHLECRPELAHRSVFSNMCSDASRGV
jgi:hypothetical protein